MNLPLFASRWPEWREPSQHLLRAMLNELDGLSITGGESSVRFSPSGVEHGRWLAGFTPEGVARERLMGLPARLGMPAQSTERFQTEWPRARQIGLAVEQTAQRVVAKVYLEYALPAPDVRALQGQQRQVTLQIESFKWRVDEPVDPRASMGNTESTEYWRLSGLDGLATVQILRDTEAVAPMVQAVYAGVAQVLQNALRAAPGWQGHRLLLVRDPHGGRSGVGVRFYGSEFRVGAVAEPFSKLFDAWGLHAMHLFEPTSFWAEQELGWLHAGLDAQSQPYLIVYGALNSADTRAVLSQAGSARREPRALLQEN
jgi:hypothetical protein